MLCHPALRIVDRLDRMSSFSTTDE